MRWAAGSEAISTSRITTSLPPPTVATHRWGLVGVLGFGVLVLGLEIRGVGYRFQGFKLLPRYHLHPSSHCRDSNVGFEVFWGGVGFEFWVLGFEVRVQGFGVQVAGIKATSQIITSLPPATVATHR